MKGSKLLEPLRQKPDKNPWSQSPSAKQFNAIHLKLFALCAPMVCDLCRAWKTWTRINSEIEIG